MDPMAGDQADLLPGMRGAARRAGDRPAGDGGRRRPTPRRSTPSSARCTRSRAAPARSSSTAWCASPMCSRRRSTASAAGSLAPTPDVMKTMLRAADVLADLVRGRARRRRRRRARSHELVAELTSIEPSWRERRRTSRRRSEAGRFGFQPRSAGRSTATATAAGVEPDTSSSSSRSPSSTPRATRRCGCCANSRGSARIDVDCDDSRVAAADDLDPEGAYLAWTRHACAPTQDRARSARCSNSSTAIAISRSSSTEPRRRAAMSLTRRTRRRSSRRSTRRRGGRRRRLRPRPRSLTAAAPSASSPRQRRAEAGQGRRRRPTPGDASRRTIRVDLDRVDRLINLVGELVINQAMLTQRVLEAGLVARVERRHGLDELEHLTREIQESVMAIRAQPVRPLFQRMSRLVREVADADRQAGAPDHRGREHRGRPAP